jgi:gliding motility-associated-like protein
MKYVFFITFLYISLVVSAQQFIELCNGETRTVTYYSTATGDGTNTWSVNGLPFFSDELTYTFSNVGSYNIVVKRENGPCYVQETLQVVVTECPGVIYWVPNCFTPDGNEENQLFGPVMTEGYDINGFKFLIFNRWGNIVWESEDPNGKWDGTYQGKLCTDGVYIWTLVFNVFGDDGKITDHGHLTIIR